MNALMTRPHRVYYHLDAAGEVLYVGVTSNAYNRKAMHQAHSDWWHLVADITYTEPMSRQDAGALEVAEIQRIRPPHNRRVPATSVFTQVSA